MLKIDGKIHEQERDVSKFWKNKEYKPTNEEIKHPDSVLKMFLALTGDKRFETVYNTLL